MTRFARPQRNSNFHVTHTARTRTDATNGGGREREGGRGGRESATSLTFTNHDRLRTKNSERERERERETVTAKQEGERTTRPPAPAPATDDAHSQYHEFMMRCGKAMVHTDVDTGWNGRGRRVISPAFSPQKTKWNDSTLLKAF